MGMFNKSPKENEDTPEAEEFDPLQAVTATIAAQQNPVLFIGLVIAGLLHHEVVVAADFEKIGITLDELEALGKSMQESQTAQELDESLSVMAEIRRYNRVIESIATERGVVLGTDAHRSLRTVLTTFAAENNVLDLRIAYRLILAECPEKLVAA